MVDVMMYTKGIRRSTGQLFGEMKNVKYGVPQHVNMLKTFSVEASFLHIVAHARIESPSKGKRSKIVFAALCKRFDIREKSTEE